MAHLFATFNVGVNHCEQLRNLRIRIRQSCLTGLAATFSALATLTPYEAEAQTSQDSRSTFAKEVRSYLEGQVAPISQTRSVNDLSDAIHELFTPLFKVRTESDPTDTVLDRVCRESLSGEFFMELSHLLEKSPASIKDFDIYSANLTDPENHKIAAQFLSSLGPLVAKSAHVGQLYDWISASDSTVDLIARMKECHVADRKERATLASTGGEADRARLMELPKLVMLITASLTSLEASSAVRFEKIKTDRARALEEVLGITATEEMLSQTDLIIFPNSDAAKMAFDASHVMQPPRLNWCTIGSSSSLAAFDSGHKVRGKSGLSRLIAVGGFEPHTGPGKRQGFTPNRMLRAMGYQSMSLYFQHPKPFDRGSGLVALINEEEKLQHMNKSLDQVDLLLMMGFRCIILVKSGTGSHAILLLGKSADGSYVAQNPLLKNSTAPLRQRFINDWETTHLGNQFLSIFMIPGETKGLSLVPDTPAVSAKLTELGISPHSYLLDYRSKETLSAIDTELNAAESLDHFFETHPHFTPNHFSTVNAKGLGTIIEGINHVVSISLGRGRPTYLFLPNDSGFEVHVLVGREGGLSGSGKVIHINPKGEYVSTPPSELFGKANSDNAIRFAFETQGFTDFLLPGRHDNPLHSF